MSLVAAPPVSLDEYIPVGSNWELCTAKEQEVIGTGQSGSGKTRALIEKIHRACREYENIKVLLLRKREADLGGSALEMYRDWVAGPELASGEVTFYDKSRSEPARYEYRRSGSVIVIGGLWPPQHKTKVTSSEWDIVCVIAANELTEHDWELLIPLCRNGALPVNQLIGECQPQDEEHWILKRAQRGQLRLIEGTIEDNPRWYRDGALTVEGRAFLAKLDLSLTGVNKLRNRYGRWTSAQGMCLPSFDANRHVIDPFQVPPYWPTYWVIDFGKVHAFSWQHWVLDTSRRGFMTREIHMTERETEDHCDQILYVTQHLPQPELIITDHSANDRLICERVFGRGVTLADKRVIEGIDYLDKRFAAGKAYLFRDALVEVDQAAKAKGWPINLAGEIPGYTWKLGRRSAEGPNKIHDDACDAARYWAIEMDRPEEWEVSWD